LVNGDDDDNPSPSHDDAESSSECDSSVDSESSIQSGDSSHLLENNSLRGYYDEIVTIIDRLFSVSIRIRGTTRNFRLSRAAGYVEKDDDGDDVLPTFKRILGLKIARLGPFAPEWLVDRLKNTIAMRRQQFYYQRAHKKHLSKIRTPLQQDAEIVSMARQPKPMPTHLFDASRPQGTMEKPESSTAPRTDKSISTTKTHDTVATEPLSEDPQQADLAKPTKTEIAENIFPEPPKQPVGKDFECHQCFLILPARYRTKELWRLVSVVIIAKSKQKASSCRPTTILLSFPTLRCRGSAIRDSRKMD
jgi:hypothetical protein